MKSKTYLTKALNLLPVAFAIHNFEEVLGMEAWTKSVPNFVHPPVTTKQFAVAAVIFTILGFAVIFAKNLYKSGQIYLILATGFAGMLFLNVFFPHLIWTLYFRQYTPGIITAVFLNLPLTAFILQETWRTQEFSGKQFFAAIISGGLIGLMLVFILLKIGEILTN